MLENLKKPYLDFDSPIIPDCDLCLARETDDNKVYFVSSLHLEGGKCLCTRCLKQMSEDLNQFIKEEDQKHANNHLGE